VQRLRAAGAVILGKTVTTELAYFAPGKTRNPHDPARTPGGSSSGSAAAVAARMLPAALGTQTAGSVIRPASFCGVIGFKPTYGTLPLGGVMPFAPSLDTLGFFARELEDLPLLFGVLAGTPLRAAERSGPPRIGLLQTQAWAQLEPAMERLLDETARALGAATVPLPREWAALLDVQKTIMAAEAARSFAADRAREAELSPQLRALLAGGDAMDERHLSAAREDARRAREILPALFARHDALLAPSALGEAPPREQGTGDPSLNRAFTLLGVPCISLPLGKGPSGLPLGLQLVGPPGREADLIAIASAVLTCAPRA
jgi:Asp-tRNA(Asn)/Glu-tRNA(Gln) amidotransferase A subunit family amidase